MTRDEIIAELIHLQRDRAAYLKSRNSQQNRLRTLVASRNGYHSGLPKAERLKGQKEAQTLIDRITKGESHPLSLIVLDHSAGISRLLPTLNSLERQMEKLVANLSVAPWCDHPDQRGCGLKTIATVVGECGNLSLYSNPGKVWRRMSSAPHTFNGKTLMGATWRSKKEGVLPSDQWTEYGYCPRRRAICYNIAVSLLKGNRIKAKDPITGKNTDEDTWTGPYIARYETKKAEFADLHPDFSKKRCHLHGLLLTSKLLLKNLWIEWTRIEGILPDRSTETDKSYDQVPSPSPGAASDADIETDGPSAAALEEILP
jgi:hypothetical protein